MKLYPHQQALVDRNPPRHLIAHSTGTGKTITSISLANKNCETCLVIVPKMLKEQWKREIEKHKENCVYDVITKEEFKRDYRELPRYDGIIIDESHFFANRKSQLSKSLRYFCKKQDVRYRWLCTATPYLSTPWNIYSLAEHLGYKWNYRKFEDTFFQYVPMGSRRVPVIRKNKEDELAKLVHLIGSVVDMEEIVEVPEQSFETIYFDLTEEQKKGIKELEDTQFITRWTRTHQIENGLLYGGEYEEDKVFTSNKTEKIVEMCKSHDKIAIFCRYTKQIEMLKDILKDIKDVYVLEGKVKNRDSVIQDINSNNKCITLIQSQCSVGYELPTINTIVFASLSFSYVDLTQAIGRFLRINRLKENKYYHLVSKGVDKNVYDSIMRKEDFYITLKE